LAPGGFTPYAGLIMDTSGNFYGTASAGGAFGDGTVFELAHGSSRITPLATFNGTNGASPYGGLIMDASGNLYGTTTVGGAFQGGTVFELAHGSGTITMLASFDPPYADSRQSALVMDSSGNLYGTTSAGGANGDGTVFEVAKGSGTITTLASFNGTFGGAVSGLIMDASGNLYGTTQLQGANSHGSVFELAHGSGTITTLASFNGANGFGPVADLIMDGRGNLYGTTTYGGANDLGTVFELAKGSGTITTLASFNGTNGSQPASRLVMDQSGNLYGTTYTGGANAIGTVFELAHGSGTISTLASFNVTNGKYPSGSLVRDGSGNIYGTTRAGGVNDDGTVFEVAQGSGTITTLASFVYNGLNPHGGLAMDGSGNLYGTASGGGAFADGTVFEVAKGSGTITALASFNGSNGANPYGDLIMDKSGNLYGTAESGGASGDGTVFELAKGTSTITPLASFNGGNGANPYGGLLTDSSGNLYGTTSAGGAFGDGTVFEVVKGSGTITALASFNGTDGSQPLDSLVMDSSGNLYGTAETGDASGNGTVFELAKGSGTITALASFNGTNGAKPVGALIMDSSDNLYGTSSVGGASGDSTVFELAKGSGTITTLVSFDGANGANPNAGLVMDSTGSLFGTTVGGGLSGWGTIFEVDRGIGAITTRVSFELGNGAFPYASLLLDSKGNLYGTASYGGAPYYGGEFISGTVFELSGGATDQWTGANLAVDTNWSDGANWSLGTPPIAGQPVLFTNNSSVKAFTSTVDAGFTNSIGGLRIDSTWGGTITVNTALSVAANFSLASGSFGGSGAVTIAGTASQWTGGQIVVGAGGFTITGTLNADTTGGNLVVIGAGTLTNDGTINEAGSNSLVLENSAALNNASGTTFDLTNNGSVSQSGGGTLTNAGTLEKTGGTGTSTIATTTLSNTGTVAVTSGTVNISATVAQVSGTTLTAGTWAVTSSSTAQSKLDITSAGSFSALGSAAKVTLNGLNTTFSNLSGLSTIASGASFSLLGGRSFTTTGALTNDGSLLLGGGSFTTSGALTNNGSLTLAPGIVLTVGGSFTQTSTGSLTIELAGTVKKPIFGQVVSTTGTVALGGSLNVTSTVVPAVGSAFELLDNEGNSAISGIFAALSEGSTFMVTVRTTKMTFQIAYAGTDSDGRHNLVITRTL
jgi:uncharacterized repeat protein (TIGR03803 family)